MAWLALAWAIVSADPAAGTELEALVVLDLDNRGAPETVWATANNALADSARALRTYRVVTAAELRGVAELQKSRIELGAGGDDPVTRDVVDRALARWVLAGSLGRVGEELTLTLSLLDEREKESRGSVTLTFSPTEEPGPVVERAVSQLFGDLQAVAPREEFTAEEGLSLAVFDFDSTDVGADLLKNLTQVVAIELKGLEGATVISSDDIAALLELEARKTSLNCSSEEECLAEIGGALGVRKLVSGTIARTDRSYVITLRLIDVQLVSVDNRVTETFEGVEGQLLPAVRLAARRLVGGCSRSPISNHALQSINLSDRHREEIPLPCSTDTMVYNVLTEGLFRTAVLCRNPNQVTSSEQMLLVDTRAVTPTVSAPLGVPGSISMFRGPEPSQIFVLGLAFLYSIDARFSDPTLRETLDLSATLGAADLGLGVAVGDRLIISDRVNHGLIVVSHDNGSALTLTSRTLTDQLSDPEAIALHPDGKRLYVASRLDGQLRVVDISAEAPEAWRVLRRLPVGAGLSSLAVEPGLRGFRMVCVGVRDVDPVTSGTYRLTAIDLSQ